MSNEVTRREVLLMGGSAVTAVVGEKIGTFIREAIAEKPVKVEDTTQEDLKKLRK